MIYGRSFLVLAYVTCVIASQHRCRNIPGDPGFPSELEWSKFNESIGGRLVAVVPSAQFCHELPAGSCPENEWESMEFRSSVPGAMGNYDWEQDYVSHPPSLCLQNGTTCGQGNVPVYAVNATNETHIQAGVKFAVKHNLKVAVKASGHDFLGRSTAIGSLLLWTRNLRNVTFFDSFIVGRKDMGSAMTVGSGLPANLLYNITKDHGKFYIGPNTATAVPAGGYIQGAGHSAFSPLFGLGADNVLEFKIVIANGSFITANAVENPDLFFALRGGGAGSWGVIVSATLRTFPTFNATQHNVDVLAATNASTKNLMAIHARHVFDWDDVRAGQYFTVFTGSAGVPGNQNGLTMTTYFVNMTTDEASARMKPLLDDIRSANFTVSDEAVTVGLANDFMESDDVFLGINDLLGSRLIPASVYRSNPEAIGQGYEALLEQGVIQIIGHVLAGGKVSENANIGNAVTPKWRSAKTHVIATTEWPDSFTPAEVETVKQTMTHTWVPILANMTGENDSGAYSNEADVREPNFQLTFFGTNYPRLKAIKEKYDPDGLFIVGAGVGSEDWDTAGVCRVA